MNPIYEAEGSKRGPACPVPGVTLGLHHKDHFWLSLKSFKLWFNMIKTGVLSKIAVFFFLSFQTAPATHTDACLTKPYNES